MKTLILILTLISFQFLIAGCGGGVFFGEEQNTLKKSSTANPSTLSVNAPLAGQTSDSSVVSQNNRPRPSVKFIKPPKDYIFGMNIQIVFEIIEGDRGIVKVTCTVDGQNVPCNGESRTKVPRGGTDMTEVEGHLQVGTNQPGTRGTSMESTLNLGQMEPGKHRLRIMATDEDGDKYEITEKWSVYEKFRQQEQGIHVVRKKDKLDILFVIDNSPTMMNEQPKIGKGFSNFISKLNGLDWRIGITTTDPSEATFYMDFSNVDDHNFRSNDDGTNGLETKPSDWSGGRLSALTFGTDIWGRPKEKYPYLTPNVKNAQKILSQNLQRREQWGSDSTEGIHTTYRAIERAVANNSKENRLLNKFFRRDAALAVILISDKDDVGSFIRNNPENLIAHVKRSFGEDKVFQFHSIVAHTQSCIKGEGHSYAYNYVKLSRLTGGVIGDICSDKYERMLVDIGSGLFKLTKTTYQTTCLPQDTNNNGVVNLQITPRNPNTKIPGYTINGSHINFDRPLESGNYELDYFCLKD